MISSLIRLNGHQVARRLWASLCHSSLMAHSTFGDRDSNFDPGSDPILVVVSYDWNLNSTICSVNSYA